MEYSKAREEWEAFVNKFEEDSGVNFEPTDFINEGWYLFAEKKHKEIAELKKQRDELIKYARHGIKCMYGFQGDKWKCTCKLEQLLPEPPKTEQER